MAWLVGEKVLTADAGIIERDIKPSEVLNRPVEGGDEVLGFRDVTATERGAATLRAGYLDRLTAAILIDIGNHDLRPTFGQREYRSSPDPRSAATDDGHLAFNLYWLHLPRVIFLAWLEMREIAFAAHPAPPANQRHHAGHVATLREGVAAKSMRCLAVARRCFSLPVGFPVWHLVA